MDRKTGRDDTQRRATVVLALLGALGGLAALIYLLQLEPERPSLPVVEAPPPAVKLPPSRNEVIPAQSGTLRGKVIDGITKKPLGGAEIHALKPYLKFEKDNEIPLWGELRKAKTVRSRSDGSFELTDLPRDFWNLWVERKGYSWTTVPRAKFAEEHVIVLMPACSARGRVMYEDETPAVGVHVEYTPQGTHSEVFARFARKQHFTKTDADGYFEYRDIPHGKFTVEVYPDDHLPAPWTAEPALKPGENRDLGTHYLDTGFGMEVTVLWRGTNMPVANVEVSVLPAGDPMPRTKTGRRKLTNSLGIAKFSGLGGQVIEKPGFIVTANIDKKTIVMPDEPGLVKPNSKVTIYLRKNGRVTGKVVGTDGQPLLHYHASLRGIGHSAQQLSTFSKTGEFTIYNVPEGRYKLRILAREFAEITKEIEVFGGQATDVGLLSAQRGAEVYGTIRRSNQTAVEGVVRVIVAKRVRGKHGREQFEEVRRAYAKQDATYRIFGLLPGTYWIQPDLVTSPSSNPTFEKVVIGPTTGAIELDLVVSGHGTLDLQFFDEVEKQLRQVVQPKQIILVNSRNETETRWLSPGTPIKSGKYDVYVVLPDSEGVSQRYKCRRVTIQEGESTGPIRVELHQLRD